MANEVIELNGSRAIRRDATGSEVVRSFRMNNANPEEILFYGLVPPHGYPHPSLPLLYVDEVQMNPVTEDGSKTTNIQITYREWPLSMTRWAEVWTWDIGAEQTHISSVKNSSYAAHYPVTEDVGTAIGTDGETTEGVDVYRPAGTLTVEKMLVAIHYTDRLILEAMAPSVNNAYWFGYQAGEVLFQGAKVQRTNTGNIRVSFNFLLRRYQGVQTIELLDGTPVYVDALPFDYIWYRHGEKPVTADGKTFTKRGIKSVHIAQVYEYYDFSIFNLVGPYG